VPLHKKTFFESLVNFKSETDIAIALSGGGDSMALTHLLSLWTQKHNINLHILHVDHGLRIESKKEAQQIQTWLKNISHSQFKILTWKHSTIPTKKIQELAREARYELMANYCAKAKVNYLFIAHHADDQMETILFRLIKSSGIDGMAGMKILQPYTNSLTLVRPLLSYTHDDLIQYCQKEKLNWIEDSSNRSDQFSRVRLRQSKDILAAEGLTAERLLLFSVRCARAKQALNYYADIYTHTLKLK
jgi:tRNA(Ile)-lysidine synthase